MNKTAIVTGGTSGIGFAISKALVERGDNVIAIYANNDTKANNAKETLKTHTGGGL